MSRPCRNVEDIVSEVRRIIETEKADHPEDGAEFFFRGEAANFATKTDEEIGTHFSCALNRSDKPYRWKKERELYQEGFRYNVASFAEDRTMTERLARMEHFGLPTRFADLSGNALQAAFFGAGGWDQNPSVSNSLDGWIRVFKIAERKMKSFTSDIIVAISHLPLVSPDRIHLYDGFDKTDEDSKGLNVLRYEIMKERPAFGFEAERPVAAARLRKEIQQVWAFKPLRNSTRIRNQDGIFLAFGCGDQKKPLIPTFSPEDYDNDSAPSSGIKQVGAVRIGSAFKTDILHQLRWFGLQSEVVYPELSEVCRIIDERVRESFNG